MHKNLRSYQTCQRIHQLSKREEFQANEQDQAKLIEMLKTPEETMIASGNALPPPAYEVVCDIDGNEHNPIQQRARRITIRYSQKR
ncbi:hypothetical protein PHMEG_0001233 [Phytophthora megakarya]|uniref:Reverse transcriptase n=1 Tax=Phytophthora megakarya TaxID=4795 RepID=A0A225X274_9STRA|nr:hypothetical protein PHMEG_0001233 [Phytophthora megakarya]